mgnify:CR=1 FL=1
MKKISLSDFQDAELASIGKIYGGLDNNDCQCYTKVEEHSWGDDCDISFVCDDPPVTIAAR